MTRDWYAQRDRGDEEHPVDDEVRQRLGRSLVDLDRRILRLKNEVVGAGDGSVWLELEALLNERASLREAAYYNAGVEDGRAHGALEELLGDRPSGPDSSEALRLLAELGATVTLLARRAARVLHGRPRVLLVEDESLLARSLERTLSEHTVVRAASSAEQALVALRQEDFDLVLTDLQLGRRDGLWLLEEVRRIHPAAKRVLMSASDVDADALTASGVAHAFVPKTDIPAALMPTLMRVLAWPR